MPQVLAYIGLAAGIIIVSVYGIQFLLTGLAYTLAQDSEKAQLMLFQSGTKALIGVGLIWFSIQLLRTTSS